MVPPDEEFQAITDDTDLAVMVILYRMQACLWL
jgi:hypothetical protein